MTTVYVLLEVDGWEPEYTVVGVYSSEALAEQAKQAFGPSREGNWVDIEVHTLDEMPSSLLTAEEIRAIDDKQKAEQERKDYLVAHPDECPHERVEVYWVGRGEGEQRDTIMWARRCNDCHSDFGKSLRP